MPMTSTSDFKAAIPTLGDADDFARWVERLGQALVSYPEAWEQRRTGQVLGLMAEVVRTADSPHGTGLGDDKGKADEWRGFAEELLECVAPEG